MASFHQIRIYAHSVLKRCAAVSKKGEQKRNSCCDLVVAHEEVYKRAIRTHHEDCEKLRSQYLASMLEGGGCEHILVDGNEERKELVTKPESSRLTIMSNERINKVVHIMSPAVEASRKSLMLSSKLKRPTQSEIIPKQISKVEKTTQKLPEGEPCEGSLFIYNDDTENVLQLPRAISDQLKGSHIYI